MKLEHCAFYLAMNENDWGELIHLMSRHFGQNFKKIKDVSINKAETYPEIFVVMDCKCYGWRGNKMARFYYYPSFLAPDSVNIFHP